MSERSEVRRMTQILRKLGVHWTKITVKSSYKSPCCNAKIGYGHADAYPFESGSACSKCGDVLTLNEKRKYTESLEDILYVEDIAKILVNRYKIGTKDRFKTVLQIGNIVDHIVYPINYEEENNDR